MTEYTDMYKIEKTDMTRPWGGFHCIHPDDLDKFIEDHFGTITINKTLPLSPKVLIVKPGKRLSWQYHHRRMELWKVLEGPVGIMLSETDGETSVVTYQRGDVVCIETGWRHRLIGLETQGVVAELWCHTDITNPSDENDIVRVQDDYGR